MEKYYICVDDSGGMCDRICKGLKGLNYNTNATLETWKDSYTDDEKPIISYLCRNEEDCISILNTDNFHVNIFECDKVYLLDKIIVTNKECIFDKRFTDISVLNPLELEYTKDGIYNIY